VVNRRTDECVMAKAFPSSPHWRTADKPFHAGDLHHHHHHHRSRQLKPKLFFGLLAIATVIWVGVAAILRLHLVLIALTPLSSLDATSFRSFNETLRRDCFDLPGDERGPCIDEKSELFMKEISSRHRAAYYPSATAVFVLPPLLMWAIALPVRRWLRRRASLRGERPERIPSTKTRVLLSILLLVVAAAAFCEPLMGERHSSRDELSPSVILGLEFSALWVLLATAGLVAYRKRGLWLLLGAPFALFLPVVAVGLLAWNLIAVLYR
jgi:hypothetical protein